MMVDDGDQPYYERLHVGVGLGAPVTREITCYGIGRKLRDGSVVALYQLPNGVLCVSRSDAERVGSMLIRSMG